MRTLNEIFACYVPALAIQGVRDEQPRRAIQDRVPCAVLFADISGFTALTERLARDGPAGIEALTHILNNYFGRLVEVVVDHGGDVVKFAGDALLALWTCRDEEEGALAEQTLRAAACALAAQELLSRYVPPESDPLSLRVAIGAGVMTAFHIGGQLNRFEFVVGGPPLTQVGRAGESCEPGTVVLSPEAWTLIKDEAQGRTIDERAVALLATPQAPEPRALDIPEVSENLEPIVRSYIPGAIRSEIESGHDVWLAELRRVTVIFVNLPDLDADMPLAQAQMAMNAMQTILYQYEGSVNKLSVDDKGISLLAAFGLPPLAHEDDPDRGLRAALRMKEALDEVRWRSSFGVATGQAFCGLVGSDKRREYTMIGDVVNLSARLMQAAGNGVLCDETSKRGAGERLSFDELTPLKLKGKRDPVPVFRPRRSRGTTRLARSRLPMVGRRRELEILRAKVEELQRGVASVVILGGEPGIGKSRFVQDGLGIAEDADLDLAIGRAEAIERATPYFAWRGVLETFLGLDESYEIDPRAVLEETFDHEPEIRRLAPLIGEVLGLPIPDNEFTAPMKGEIRAENVRRLVCAFLQLVADERPTMIVIGNAQWLDSRSWSLIDFVSRTVHPLMLVLTTRPLAAPPDEYFQLLGNPDTRELTFDGLSETEIAEVVCQHLNVGELPAKISALLGERAHGNPFFALELTYSLRDAGIISVRRGRCLLADPQADLDGLALPDTVQGVLRERIDRLEAGEQMALKVASVIGPSFDIELMRAVYPIPEDLDRLEASLAALEVKELIERDRNQSRVGYAFESAVTQEVAYNLMLFAQRRALHRAIAEQLETRLDSAAPPEDTLLAYHWGRAEVAEKAAPYFEKAAARALKNFAGEEAIALLEQAMKLDPDAAPRRRANWHLMRGEARYALGQWTESRLDLGEACRLLKSPVPASLLAQVMTLLIQALIQTCHRLAPRLLLHRKRDPDNSGQDCARALERLAQIYYMNNEKIPCLTVVLQSLNLSESLPLAAELGPKYANMAVVAGLVPLHKLAEKYCRLADEVAERAADPDQQNYVFEVNGIYHSTVADWPKAEEETHLAITRSLVRGDLRRWDESQFSLVLMAQRRGLLDEAQEQSRALAASGLRRRIPQVEVWGLAGLLNALPDGAFDNDAITRLAAILILHKDDGKILATDRAYGYGALALALWSTGQRDAPLAHARRVVALIKAAPDATSHYLLESYADAAHILVEAWREADARQAPAEELAALRDDLEVAVRALKDFARFYPVGVPAFYMRRGQLRAIEGRLARARRDFETGLAAAEATGVLRWKPRIEDAITRLRAERS